MRTAASRCFSTIAAVLLAVGCGSNADRAQPQEKSSPVKDGGLNAEGPKVDFSGTLRGFVKLADGATLPLASLPQAGKTDTVVAPECPPIGETDRKQVAESETSHGLFPLHVAITGMTEAPKREPVTHDMAINDCRLTPGMVAAKTGDKLRIRNNSKVPFLPVLPGEPFMQAILAGGQREITISGIGPVSIACGFASYCGESTLLSTAHSLYAVTDAQGRFTITGVPLDQELTVHAWHPLFTPVSVTFKLSKAEPSKDVELAIQPLPEAKAATDAAVEKPAPKGKAGEGAREPGKKAAPKKPAP